MPELPEVETIRRQMSRELAGRRVKSVTIRYGGRIFPSPERCAEAVTGSAFQAFGRRAKLLLLHLTNGWTIVVHLKMTGKFLLRPQGALLGKHTHVIFFLDGGEELHFDDVRKFGYFKMCRTTDLEKEIFAREGFGPEPLDAAFTLEAFTARLASRGRKCIKPLLMDPRCIAGIGNIYADEACWYACVRPTRRAERLTARERAGLYSGIQKTLRESLKYRGASAENYLDLYGEKGESVAHLKAYGKTICTRCRGIIKKITIGARSAHYCPTCQK